MSRLIVTPAPGQCRECMKRRDVFSCLRLGGGTYRTPPRQRSSSVCAECALDLFTRATYGHDPRGWATTTLRDIVASLDTDEAREATTTYDAEEAEREAFQAAEQIRMLPYWDRIAERREIAEWVKAQQHVDGMDPTTCQAIGYGIRKGNAGHENTGTIYVSGQPATWDLTMREQVIAYMNHPGNAYLDGPTLRALADGIRDGLHRP